MLETQQAQQTDHQGKQEQIIFSAYELGKSATRVEKLEADTGIRAISAQTPVPQAYELYNATPVLDFLPVTDSGHIVGYLRRQMFLAALSESMFARELLLRRDQSVELIMESRVMCLDAFTTLSDASDALMARDEDVRFDPFVVTLDNQYFGISSVRRVLENLNKYFRMDLDACRDAQVKLMTTEVSTESAVDFRAETIPVSGPGGDYTDRFEIDEHLSLLVCIDVCGKGIKASNMVMAIGTALKAMLAEMPRPILSLKKFELPAKMRQLNSLLYEITPQEMYATGAVFLIDKHRRLMEVMDFGHGMIWLRRGDQVFRIQSLSEDDSELSFLGIADNLEVKSTRYRLEPGDMIFSCSDGLVEARSRNKSEFGMHRVARVLRPHSDPNELVEAMLGEWTKFRDDYHMNDDVTVMAARI